MTSECFVPLEFDSSTIAEADQFRTYASGMANFAVTRAKGGAFRAQARIWRIGRLVFSSLQADPATFERSERHIAGGAVDHVYVNYHARGSVRLHDGRGAVQEGGAASLAVIDMRQPCRLEVAKIRQFSLAIPRHAILPRLGGLDPHGMVAAGGLIPLLAAQLSALERTLPGLSLRHGGTLERQICDLVVDTVGEALARREAAVSRDGALVNRARVYMNERLGRPLTVDRIAQDLAVSRSTLYRAFGSGGGVLRELQALRLRRLRQWLEDPGETRAIAALAREAGFPDPSHCVRAFRHAFGMTPHAYRTAPREALAQPLPEPKGPASAVFRTWVTSVE